MFVDSTTMIHQCKNPQLMENQKKSGVVHGLRLRDNIRTKDIRPQQPMINLRDTMERYPWM
jgi:hypothetical protein